MLASKTPYSTSLGVPTPQTSAPSYHVGSQRAAAAANSQDAASFTSPKDSEFIDAKDGMDSVRLVSSDWEYYCDTHDDDRSWDEKQVISWLHTINCGQYESLFKGNTSYYHVFE